jgi:oligopeptide transport system substrate-binding protein
MEIFMKFTKMLKKLMIFVIVAIVTISLVGCGEPADKGYTYRTYTALSPSNWNELTYQDNNDTQIMSYIGDSFFQYNFKYDENGEILPGEFVMEFGAATKLEDVTSKYVGEEYGISEGETGRAYEITLREDLKWDDGTPITAADFEYTMKEQLNPLFQNYRADSFYVGATIIHNAMGYAKQGQETYVAGSDLYSTYSADLDDKLVFKMGPSDETLNAEPYFRASMGFPASYDTKATADYLIGNYLGECAFTADMAVAMEGKTFAEIKADAAMKAAWDALIGWWQTEPNEELHFFIAKHNSLKLHGLKLDSNLKEMLLH